jgi:hypothetical protein
MSSRPLVNSMARLAQMNKRRPTRLHCFAEVKFRERLGSATHGAYCVRIRIAASVMNTLACMEQFVIRLVLANHQIAWRYIVNIAVDMMHDRFGRQWPT